MLFSRASFLGLVGAGLLACVGDTPVATPGQDSGVDATNDTGTGKDAGTDSPTEAGPAFDHTGLVLWLDAQTVSTTSGKVTKWPDQSGMGNDATQSVAADQPGYATNVKNALPGVDFGPKTFLQIPTGAGFDDFTAGISLFVAVKPTMQYPQVVSPFLRLASSTADPAPNAVQFLRRATDVSFEVTDGTGAMTDNLHGDIVVQNEFALYEAVVAGSSGTLYKNGASIFSTATFPAPAKIARTSNFVGGDSDVALHTVEGQYGEVMLFATGLSDVKRKEVEKYLMTKWNL
ncbi:MAG TPA: hypothetical protein VF316_15600 [Polyangiaceae bacterium]